MYLSTYQGLALSFHDTEDEKNIGICIYHIDAADSGRSTLREPIEFEMDIRPQSWGLSQTRSNEEYQNVRTCFNLQEFPKYCD